MPPTNPLLKIIDFCGKAMDLVTKNSEIHSDGHSQPGQPCPTEHCHRQQLAVPIPQDKWIPSTFGSAGFSNYHLPMKPFESPDFTDFRRTWCAVPKNLSVCVHFPFEILVWAPAQVRTDHVNQWIEAAATLVANTLKSLWTFSLGRRGDLLSRLSTGCLCLIIILDVYSPCVNLWD